MSRAPRTIPKIRSRHHRAPRWNPKAEKGRLSSKRPASHTVRAAADRPATPLMSGNAGESDTTDVSRPPDEVRKPELAASHATTSKLKKSGTSTLSKAEYWITNRHSALSRPVLLSRSSSKQLPLVSTLRAYALACQHFSFVRSRPGPVAWVLPLGFFRVSGQAYHPAEMLRAAKWRADMLT